MIILQIVSKVELFNAKKKMFQKTKATNWQKEKYLSG